MPVEALRKQWDARAGRAPLYAAMTFDGDDLVLGAGTRLASAAPDARKALAPADDIRLVAMLSAAYRRPIGSTALGYISRALVKRREGETAVALTHLALTGLPKLAQPQQDARRLFMADGLMRAGVEPSVIVEALELAGTPSHELERRYNPEQPRVPAGNGDESGRWTKGDTSGANGSSARLDHANARRQYAQSVTSDAERFVAEPEREDREVDFYNPETRQHIRIQTNSGLEPRAPPGFIDLNHLPHGWTFLEPPPESDPEPPREPPPEREKEGDVEGPTPADPRPTNSDKKKARAEQLARNKVLGAEWEDDVAAKRCREPLQYARQVTLLTASRLRYRIDIVSWDPVTEIFGGLEAKGSESAPLNPNQQVAIEEIARTGAWIVGRRGKPIFPGGTYLPRFRVEIVRPFSEKFMTISQRDVVDFVYPEDRDGNTSLVISDHLPWDTDEREHWYLLQEKINSYLPYIIDGDLQKEFPVSDGRKVVIVIVAKYALNDASRDFIEKLGGHTRKYGIDLRFHQYIPGVNDSY